jgi:hypothetical protein
MTEPAVGRLDDAPAGHAQSGVETDQPHRVTAPGARGEDPIRFM